MKLKKIAFILFLSIVALGSKAQHADLYIIGTVHDSCETITPQNLIVLMDQIKPDVILCELEDIYFTSDYKFNLEEYPDLLSTNENISTHRYQQKTGIDIRPYEIEGRSEFYKTTSFFKRLNGMFSEIMTSYQDKSISEESRQEWERYLQTVNLFDILNKNTLEQINTPLYIAYSDAKNRITNETCLSVTKRDFPKWLSTAQLLNDYWKERNDAMAVNVLQWLKVYEGKTVMVLAGQQHKSELIVRLELQQKEYNFLLKNLNTITTR